MRALLKRWWFWLLLSAPSLLVAGFLVSPLAKDPLKAKFDKIERGMTKAQVVEIIGAQPIRSLKWGDSPGYHEDCWSVGEAEIWVYFENGRVDGRDLCRAPTMVQRARSWVKRYI